MRSLSLVLLALVALVAVPAMAANIFTEDFTGGFATQGWTVVDNLGGSGVWVDDNPGNRSGFTNLTAPFAAADSDHFASLLFDTDLISPSIDCSDYVGTTLSFAHYFRTTGETGTVSVSNDGGSTWNTVATYTSNQFDVAPTYDISAYANRQSAVQLKFNYTTNGYPYLYYWMVDNVSVDGYGPGLSVGPSTVSGSGNPSAAVTYTMTIANNTADALTADITYAGNTWDVSGPSSKEVAAGALATIDVVVTIPVTAASGDTDSATVTVTSGEMTSSATIVTTASGDWMLSGAAQLGVMDHAVVSDGAYLYRIGGYDGTLTGTGTIERYSEAKGTWEYLTACPHTLGYTVAAAVLEGRIYVMAGQIDADVAPLAGAFMVYDIATDAWDDTLATVPGDGTWAGALVAVGGKIYKLGGGSIPGDSSATVHAYDPAAGTWSDALASMNLPRGFFCSWVYDTKIWVVGGEAPTPDGYSLYPFDSGEVYDPATDAWTFESAKLPGARWGMACPQVGPAGQFVIVAAGVAPEGTLAGNSYIRNLSEADGSWSELGNMATAVYRTAGAGLSPYAYVVGGSYSPYAPPLADVQKLRVPGVPAPGTVCVIDGKEYAADAVNPDNACQICAPATSETAWSNNDGVTCDDGVFCNGADTCQDGACGTHAGDPCASNETCNETTDECVAKSTHHKKDNGCGC